MTRALRVRDLLRELILDGRFPGRLLPSERELMLQYNASRGTVRDALQLLKDEGLVARRQGTGTLVVRRKSSHPFDYMHGIAEAATALSRRIESQVVLELVPAPPPVAEFLGLEAGTPCLAVEFDTRLGQERFSTAISYLSPDRLPHLSPDGLPGLSHGGRFEGDFYEFLEAAGVRVAVGSLVVEAVNADALSAAKLGIPEGAALMLFRRRIFGVRGEPIELGFVRCRGDQLALVTRLPRASGGSAC